MPFHQPTYPLRLKPLFQDHVKASSFREDNDHMISSKKREKETKRRSKPRPHTVLGFSWGHPAVAPAIAQACATQTSGTSSKQSRLPEGLDGRKITLRWNQECSKKLLFNENSGFWQGKRETWQEVGRNKTSEHMFKTRNMTTSDPWQHFNLPTIGLLCLGSARPKQTRLCTACAQLCTARPVCVARSTQSASLPINCCFP